MQWSADKGVSRFLERSGYTGAAPFTGKEPGSNGLTFDPQGRLTLCQHGDRRISRREADGTMVPLATGYNGKRLNSPNDLVFDDQGALYFTDPPYGLPGTFTDPTKELPFQAVFRVATDGKITARRDGARSTEWTRLLARLQDPVRRQLASQFADLEGLCR